MFSTKISSSIFKYLLLPINFQFFKRRIKELQSRNDEWIIKIKVIYISRKKHRFSKISSRLSLIVGKNKHVTLLARRDLIVQRPAENILYRPVKISLISWGKLQPLSRWNLAGHASRISLTSQDKPYLKYALDACKPSTPSCVFEARGGILLFLSSFAIVLCVSCSRKKILPKDNNMDDNKRMRIFCLFFFEIRWQECNNYIKEFEYLEIRH